MSCIHSFKLPHHLQCKFLFPAEGTCRHSPGNEDIPVPLAQRMGNRAPGSCIAFGRCSTAFPQSPHRWINLLCSGEAAAEQCWGDSTVPEPSPGAHAGAQESWGCLLPAQSAATGLPRDRLSCPQEKLWFCGNSHSCSYCYLSCTNRMLLTKITVTPNLIVLVPEKGMCFASHWENQDLSAVGFPKTKWTSQPSFKIFHKYKATLSEIKPLLGRK